MCRDDDAPHIMVRYLFFEFAIDETHNDRSVLAGHLLLTLIGGACSGLICFFLRQKPVFSGAERVHEKVHFDAL